MASNIRVYELARELGLTNKECLDLCESLGIGVKSHSSSVVEPQADRVRRKAEREGLIRDVSPEEPKPAKKAAKKSAKKAAAPLTDEPVEVVAEPAPEVVEPAPVAPAAEVPAEPEVDRAEAPEADQPVAPEPTPEPVAPAADRRIG